MKRVLLIVLLANMLWGCSEARVIREQYIETVCYCSTEELIQQMSAYFLTNNWNIVRMDPAIGYLEALSNETFDSGFAAAVIGGVLYQYQPKWTIQAVDNYVVDTTASPITTEKRGKKIIAICTHITTGGTLNNQNLVNQQGHIFYADSTEKSKKHQFYWNTRNAFLRICGRIDFKDRVGK